MQTRWMYCLSYPVSICFYADNDVPLYVGKGVNLPSECCNARADPDRRPGSVNWPEPGNALTG